MPYALRRSPQNASLAVPNLLKITRRPYRSQFVAQHYSELLRNDTIITNTSF